MDRPMVHGSPVSQPWSQPYRSAPPHPNHPRPMTAPYPPPHNPHNFHNAPALYPTAVTQQMPHRYSQPPPLPGVLVPGMGRPRARSSVSNNFPYAETPPPVPQFPSFPTPSPAQFTLGPSFPPTPVPPSKPPALQPQLIGYPFPNPTRDEMPIRPAPMSARRSSSSPAINRISSQGQQPPPVPPLPPFYPGHPQHSSQRVSLVPPPPPPPSIPIPSINTQPYRSDSSPLYDSPYETAAPPIPPPPRFSSPPGFPTGPPPKFEDDTKKAPIDEEEEEFARALALSEMESKKHSGKVSREEEENLAKAIEESLRHASYFGMPVPSTEAGPSRLPSTVSSPSFSATLPVSESPVSSHIPHPSPHTPHLSASRPASKMSSPLIHAIDDATFAKQLAEEEDRAAAEPPIPQPVPPSAPPYTAPEVTTPPAPAPAPTPNMRRRQDMPRPKLSTVETESDPSPPLYHHVIGSAQASIPTKTSPISPNNTPSIVRSSSASAVTPTSSRLSPIPGKDERPSGGRSQSLDAVPSPSGSAGSNSVVPGKSGSLPTVEESQDSSPVQYPSSSSGLSSTGPPALGPTPNSFIDQQLLYGVSLGFNPPQISSIKTTLKGGVPNVISLPTGRFVPFHIQAPDWRHLLKMMARLSGTRVEASIEAMAGTKQELKLRTVVQFVRVNTTSQDWRTVLYLTIDNPPPSNAPHKFTNGDVNTLPFSYAATSLPTLLRDGPDAPMSKYYTIPATSSTPYPTLPISFPNMAMYLASAVEDSRRMGHDSSSGMKRLARTLDTLYPAEVQLGMEDDEPDKPAGGVMGALRNVFGRGKKDQRRNDDNYADLVTPFVPEWG